MSTLKPYKRLNTEVEGNKPIMQSTVEQDVRRKAFSITASDVQPYPEV